MGMKIIKSIGFLNQNKTRPCLIPNPNHEIRKTKLKTWHVQNKNLKRFYYKNKTRTKQGYDKKKYTKN
jgi:hypothetical protein